MQLPFSSKSGSYGSYPSAFTAIRSASGISWNVLGNVAGFNRLAPCAAAMVADMPNITIPSLCLLMPGIIPYFPARRYKKGS